MGLLKVGKPLRFDDAKEHLKYVREHGVLQFLNTWNRLKDLSNDELLWGDEIECGVFIVDPLTKTVKLSLRSHELLAELSEKESNMGHQSEACSWHPEFGRWMVESTPSRPYMKFANDLLRVERNMVLRRTRLLSCLKPNEIAPTVTCFPLMGVPWQFWCEDNLRERLQTGAATTVTVKERVNVPALTPHSLSTMVPDSVINPHPRFAALVENIRMRRGSKVDIQVPLFRDVLTPEFNGGGVAAAAASAAAPVVGSSGTRIVEPNTNVHMDCMAFGMGMNCLQVTFQAGDIDESRYMYDQLAVLAPIMLAVTAATPIFKGRLADVDVRWNSIGASVDCRTAAERGVAAEGTEADPQLAGGGIRRLPKSRYASVSTYIYHCKGDTNCHRTFEQYNDVPCPIDVATKQQLRDNGVDENLAHHIAHLFTRDPLVIFDGDIQQDDMESTDHFENIQSTNWQTCRWKPPPPMYSRDSPHIGWRTEFRSMEVQLTDYENAAYAVFIALITRVILAFDLKLYIPLSKVDDNMERAHKRDAIHTQKFHFRKFVAPPADSEACAGGHNSVSTGDSESDMTTPSTDSSGSSVDAVPAPSGCAGKSVYFHPECCAEDDGAQKGAEKSSWSVQDSYEEMTMNEIFHGKSNYYPGLIPLIYAYLEYIRCAKETFAKLDEYLQYISRKVSGQTMTTAAWMRKFVTTHSAYRGDSYVSEEIAYDLLQACKEIGEGKRACPEILGKGVTIQRIEPRDAYGTFLKGTLSAKERHDLMNKFIQRALARQRSIRESERTDEELVEQTVNNSLSLGKPPITTPRSSSSSGTRNNAFNLHSQTRIVRSRSLGDSEQGGVA